MHATVRKKHVNNFLFTFLFLSLLFVIYLACLLFIPSQEIRILVTDILSPIYEVIVAIILFLAAKQSVSLSKRLRIVWLVFGLAIFIYALGDLSWGILELGLKEPPFPSIADIFYLLYYPAFLSGILLIPTQKLSKWERLKRILDVSIVMLAAILAYWNFLLGPLINPQNTQSVLEQVILLAYPVGDLVLFWAILVVLTNLTYEIPRISLVLLVISLLVMVLSDSIFAYQGIIGEFLSGDIVDAGFMLSVLICGLAGAYQMSVSNQLKIKDNLSPGITSPIWRKEIFHFYSYFWLVGAYLLLIASGLAPMTMSFSSMAVFVGLIIGLVLIRQTLTFFENNQLNSKLEKTLDITQTQAEKLDLWNQKLQEEITERKHLETKLTYESLHDQLTGLPNRSLLLDRLSQVIEYNKRGINYPFSVLFLDLDSFKVINDRLGHSMGDNLLIQVGERLKKFLRSGDTVARFGGDELVILLENKRNNKSTLKAIKKIQQILNSPYDIDGTEIYVSASIGVVQNVSGYNNADDVLRDADMAMYHAKLGGKSRFEIFEKFMRTQAISRLTLENELRNGLKNHEFQLYYQPIYGLKSKNLIGFEALIRWLHPERGLLLPVEFLTVAEESGVIIPIEEWVLNEACSKLKAWQDKYSEMENITISVNISGKYLARSNFTEKIKNVLLTRGLKANSLILEITENTLITNYMKAKEIFTKLNEEGIQLYIDDFGSGYSSLSYLQNFPINAIKIDRSFINEMSKNQRGQELVRFMVLLTRQLRMDCIAEGIETEGQLKQLETMKCSKGQGFLLSKPLDEDSAEKFMVNNQISMIT